MIDVGATGFDQYEECHRRGVVDSIDGDVPLELDAVPAPACPIYLPSESVCLGRSS